jgi:hypothetical protein
MKELLKMKEKMKRAMLLKPAVTLAAGQDLGGDLVNAVFNRIIETHPNIRAQIAPSNKPAFVGPGKMDFMVCWDGPACHAKPAFGQLDGGKLGLTMQHQWLIPGYMLHNYPSLAQGPNALKSNETLRTNLQYEILALDYRKGPNNCVQQANSMVTKLGLNGTFTVRALQLPDLITAFTHRMKAQHPFIVAAISPSWVTAK